MWTLILVSLYFLTAYVSLAIVWLILGAIVNPTAFLPLATAAMTFVALIGSKYKEFTGLYTNAFKKIKDYIRKLAEE